MSAPSAHFFVYGTLLFDDIVRALTNRTFETTPARLRGFVRHAIVRDQGIEAYPAIKPDASGSIRGRLLLDVDAVSAGLIDRFEGDPPDYQPTPVGVESAGGRIIAATTYVARPSLVSRLNGAWNPAEFERVHLAYYVGHVIPEMRRAMEH